MPPGEEGDEHGGVGKEDGVVGLGAQLGHRDRRLGKVGLPVIHHDHPAVGVDVVHEEAVRQPVRMGDEEKDVAALQGRELPGEQGPLVALPRELAPVRGQADDPGEDHR